MLDSFYTPTDAALRLVSGLAAKPCVVGDFCVGGGELLRASEALFPGVKCIAIDKSKRAVKRIRTRHKHWKVFLADFLSDKDMAQTGLQEGVCDLVVLNPPFTCRGEKYKIELDGQTFSGGKALAFLVRALFYVRQGGTLRAILPSGTISSERDALLVWYLKRAYGFRTYWKSSQISFDGKTPNVVFVDMHKTLKRVSDIRLVVSKKFHPSKCLSRGCLNVVDAAKVRRNVQEDGMLRYVHTTDMRHGQICASEHFVASEGHRIVSGPAVLLPRVGTPDVDKLCVISSQSHYILSDCVIAICCKSSLSANKLKQLIVTHWAACQRIYEGTGARYTTLKKLDGFLRRIGWRDS